MKRNFLLSFLALSVILTASWKLATSESNKSKRVIYDKELSWDHTVSALVCENDGDECRQINGRLQFEKNPIYVSPVNTLVQDGICLTTAPFTCTTSVTKQCTNAAMRADDTSDGSGTDGVIGCK